MTQDTTDTIAMLTSFFASPEIEHVARLTGFVKRASKITGKLFLAFITFGLWSDPNTSLSQLAAKVSEVAHGVTVSPEAICQRMNTQAIAFLKELIRRLFEKIHSREHGCEDDLFHAFSKVYIADSTGFELPEALKGLFPGCGGSASPAGAKLQLVWDYTHHVFDHLALIPGKIPDNTYIDTVVELAQRGVLFLFDLGFFKVKALASIVAAQAYFFTRFQHQTALFESTRDRVNPFDLTRFLKTVNGSLIEKQVRIGAKDQVASRLVAARLPAVIVNERRRKAKKAAKKRGYTPSKTHLELLAWNLFITNVPPTVWMTETVPKVYPIRWQIELIVKSCQSSLHLASIPSRKEDTTRCYLLGRLLLIVLTSALCPPIRDSLWVKKRRELSLLKFVRHFQALAERWMHVIVQSKREVALFLTRACQTAERLAAKASRKRQTTAQILRESLNQQHDSVEFLEAVNA